MMPAPDSVAPREALPHVVRTVVDIAASPARVFEALTEPAELAAWWAGGDAHVSDCGADPRPGGAWHVRLVDGNGVERLVAGEYRVVDAPHRLEQSWQADDDAAPSVVRYDLEPREVGGTEGTRLTVTHSSPVALATATSAPGRASALAVHVARHPHAGPPRAVVVGRAPSATLHLAPRRRATWLVSA
ncbi:MAG TPA: SRPBCC domain-containing protein [Gemmatimonadaceae bacterium]|nr:SRPBCC domain-containing protein [Gemmatimonadaceae bacterium]